jgi:uncharacterized protein YggT (Ycf19 family)
MSEYQQQSATPDPAKAGLRVAKVLVWLVYVLLALAVVILVMTFFLQLFNASTDAAFTRWVYRNADRVLEPFRGIFPTRDIGSDGSVIDFAVVFAIVMYGLLALAIHAAVEWLDHKVRLRQWTLDREAAGRPPAGAGGQDSDYRAWDDPTPPPSTPPQ